MKLYKENNEYYEEAGFYDVINWWLEYQKGMEHLSVNPECMYTITSILERCLNKLKENKTK